MSTGTVYNWLNRRRAKSAAATFKRRAKKGKPLPRAVIDARVRSSRKYTIPGRELAVGTILTNGGYVYVLKPDHPYANALGYLAEHRLVVEKRIGRYLLASEHVHHRNEIRTDNRDENLELMTKGAHTTEHNLLRRDELSRAGRRRTRDRRGRWVDGA